MTWKILISAPYFLLVFESEPLPDDSPLRKMNNCLLAPHNANSGRAAKQRVHESTIHNLLIGLKQAN